MADTTTNTTTLRHGVTAAFPASRIGSVYALIAASALVYWPASVALVACWVEKTDRSYRHGFLILAACFWLIHRARERFAATPAQPSRVALALMIAASCAWVVFWRAAIQDLFLLLTPLILWLAIASAWGWAAARVLLFPIGFIYLAEPAWGSVAAPLQQITTVAVTVILKVMGIDAARDGTTISIPEGAFHVDLGCSGLHYLTVGVALAAFAGELERATFRRRTLLIALMVVLAVVSNWIRVATIVVAGHLTNMQHWLITRDHYWFGWVLFLLLVIGFVWFAARTEKPPAPQAPADKSRATRPETKALATALIGFSVLPLLGYATSTIDAEPYDAAAGAISAKHADWSGPFDTGAGDWKPHFVGADSLHYASYVDRAGRTVEVLVVSYRRQRQGAELVNYANSLPGAALDARAESTVVVDGVPFIETEVVDRAGRRSLIWSHYEIGGARFAVPLYSQLWYGIASLVSAPQSLLVANRAICENDCEPARATLRSFALDTKDGVKP
jgi:EpsI family protein